MEYKKTKRTNQFIFESSKHALKRQKINVNAQCKGILISPVNPRKMGVAIKEFLNFLKINYSNDYENGIIKNNENNIETNSDTKKCNLEEQLNNEITKVNLEYQRFVPLRNIIKNFAFIKFNEINDKNPSDVVTHIFASAHKKTERYKLRNICKIIPFDSICKPHLSPFVKIIIPLIKENFKNGICNQENFTISHLLKLLNISGDKEKEVEAEAETEIETKSGETEEEVKNGEVEVKTQIIEEKKVNNEKDTKNTEIETENNEETKKNEECNKNEETKKNEECNKNEEAKKNEECNKRDLKDELSNKKISWGLVYKCSNTKTLTKKDVLNVLDKCIGSNYCVNLSKPDLAIIVYVTEIMCGVSIIRDYDKTRKFNISTFNEEC